MKKIVCFTMMLLVAIGGYAQEKRSQHDGKRKEMAQNLTPQQIAELKTKRMALDLELTDAQQKEVLAINLDLAEKNQKKMEERKKMKENNEKPSNDERAAMMNARLDEQMAVQEKMKKILNDDQFEKWKKNQKGKIRHRKHGKKN